MTRLPFHGLSPSADYRTCADVQSPACSRRECSHITCSSLTLGLWRELEILTEVGRCFLSSPYVPWMVRQPSNFLRAAWPFTTPWRCIQRYRVQLHLLLGRSGPYFWQLPDSYGGERRRTM